MPTPERHPRLDRQAWVDAALRAWGESGLDAVKVEPLAAGLGTTKGSFYWHFANRAELIDAALEHWAQETTSAVIDAVRAEPEARRGDRLLEEVFGSHETDRAEWMIFSAAAHPQVQPVVDRVHRARTDYLVELFRGQGVPAARARARATVAYATYLGELQLRMTGATSAEHTTELRAELRRLLS